MTIHRHAVVFIDHEEAKIHHVDLDSFDEKTIASPHAHVRSRPDDQKHFFEDVAKALQDAEEILIVGPSTAKLQLINYAHTHDRALAAKIVGVETVDHPTDGQLVAHARKYFHVSPARVR
jgi:stalled ribosome rescue protein Dom34